MQARNGEGDSMRRASVGLGGSLALIAAALGIVVLGFFDPLTRYGVATLLLLAGLVLLATQIVWLRRRPDRVMLLWTALLDAILVVAVVLAITPLIALVHGFAELVGQSKVQSGADWLGYGFAFAGL